MCQTLLKRQIKKQKCCLSDCSVGSWVQNSCTEKHFHLSSCLIRLVFRYLKNAHRPKKRNQRSHMHDEHRSKETGRETFWRWITVKYKLNYWSNRCQRSVTGSQWRDTGQEVRFSQVNRTLVLVFLLLCGHPQLLLFHLQVSNWNS